jgi:ribosomal protein S18 acetylase RimI-like enzyme
LQVYELEVGTSADQLERMCDLASREWSWASRWHPGELVSFWWDSGGPAADDRVVTWQHDGRVIAWAWLRDGRRLDFQVAAEHLLVMEDVLSWFESGTRDGRREITVLDAETEIIASLVARGYTADLGGTHFAHLSMDLSPRPAHAVLPENYSLRCSLDGSIDPARRALLHREIFGSTRDVEPSAEPFRRLVADLRYDAGLDWMVCDEEGLAVSFCLSWLDTASSVAAVEPVGTLREHRRRGLATAAIAASLARAAARGATHARVCARVDRDDPAAFDTYSALGFTRYARNLTFMG